MARTAAERQETRVLSHKQSIVCYIASCSCHGNEKEIFISMLIDGELDRSYRMSSKLSKSTPAAMRHRHQSGGCSVIFDQVICHTLAYSEWMDSLVLTRKRVSFLALRRPLTPIADIMAKVVFVALRG